MALFYFVRRTKQAIISWWIIWCSQTSWSINTFFSKQSYGSNINNDYFTYHTIPLKPIKTLHTCPTTGNYFTLKFWMWESLISRSISNHKHNTSKSVETLKTIKTFCHLLIVLNGKKKQIHKANPKWALKMVIETEQASISVFVELWGGWIE